MRSPARFCWLAVCWWAGAGLLLPVSSSLAQQGSDQQLTHVVSKGDTLWFIAKKYGTTVSALQSANKLSQFSALYIGQRIRIPSTSRSQTDDTIVGPPPPSPAASPPSATPRVGADAQHTVKKGDTLTGIGRRYGVAPSDLARWNGLGSQSVLRLGMTLRLSPLPNDLPQSSRQVQTEIPRAIPVHTPEEDREEEETLTRADREWLLLGKAKGLIDQPSVKVGRWKYIVIHHSGSDSGSARVFDAYHREKGMENGLAYHFVIGNGTLTGDGQIEVGSRWQRQIKGGHLYSEQLNQIAIGICFVGNFTTKKPSARQVATCIELVEYLRQRCGSRVKFVVHREINPRPTECPGKTFPVKFMHNELD